MSSAFSLATPVQVFPCPNCRETINTTEQHCPFCGVAIDHTAAQAAAAETARVSKAVNDASILRVLTGLYIPAILVMSFPFLGLVGVVGFWLLRIAVPIMALIWFARYGRIQTADPTTPAPANAPSSPASSVSPCCSSPASMSSTAEFLLAHAAAPPWTFSIHPNSTNSSTTPPQNTAKSTIFRRKPATTVHHGHFSTAALPRAKSGA